MSKRSKLTDFRPQRENANAHTPHGMKALETSIQVDGWIGAITVAADGETFDGSARIETGAATGFDDAIVIESDGTRPVIVMRTDIPTADDPRAKRLGIMANRVAELNLSWDAEALDAALREIETDNPTMAALLDALATEAGIVPPDVDFKEYGEDTADDVQYCECPSCGHKFPK